MEWWLHCLTYTHAIELMFLIEVVIDSISNLTDVIPILDDPQNLVAILRHLTPDRVLLRVLLQERVAFDY